MKIKLKNFQAFRSAEFEFGPGFTLITGPTDNGKTAVFRALWTLLTNSSDAVGFINGPALQEKEDAELVVTIKDDDIPTIEFHRSKSKAWYIIDGKKYSKLARSNIFDVYPELHKKFMYDSTDFRKCLNFQTEDQLAFPFDRSDTEMFKLFEKIFNVSDTRAVIDTIRKEEDEVNFKLNQNQIEQNNLTLECNKLTDNLSKLNIDLLKAYCEQHQNSSKALGILKGKIERLSSYAPYLKIVQNLPVLKNFNEDSKCSLILDLKNKILECETKQKYVSNFADIQINPLDESFAEVLTQLQDKIQKVQKSILMLEAQNQIMSGCEESIKSINKELAEYKICPLCGHELGEK